MMKVRIQMTEPKAQYRVNILIGLMMPLIATASIAHADTQALKADIGGKVFESDDDGITLVPVAVSFTIEAITKRLRRASVNIRRHRGCRIG